MMCSSSIRLVHDPRRVLAGILSPALVCDELFLDLGVCILRSAYSLWVYRELRSATFTNAKHRDIAFSFDDPKLAFRHGNTSYGSLRANWGSACFQMGKLSLPNVVAAGTRHGVGRVLLGQLLLADWAGFSHHVGHSLRSEFLVSSGMRLSLEPDATNRGPACLIHIAHILAPSRADATDLSW